MGYKLMVGLMLVFSYTMGHAQSPAYEHVGTITINLNGLQTMVEDDLLVWNITGGKIELKDGGVGTLVQPCGDWADIQDSGTFAMNVQCNIEMSDGSMILFSYVGKFIFDSAGSEYAASGKVISPGNGAEYWVATPLMKTKSDKYAWVNEVMFVAKGVEVLFPIEGVQPYAKYELYTVVY